MAPRNQTNKPLSSREREEIKWVLREAIRKLAETKKSFKSKTVMEVRQQLEDFEQTL